MREFSIGDRRIDDDADAFVVAEIGANHMGDIQIAKVIIEAAADCGCDAVKLQKRDLDTWAALDPVFWNTPYHSENAFGATYGEHRAALEFGWDEHQELQYFAERLGLVYFATAWDLPSLDFLARLGVPVVKLASASIVDTPLLDACAVLGLPVIASTGGATQAEIDSALFHLHGRSQWLRTPVALLQCTAEYPCPAEHLNLRVIESMRDRYSETVIGLSDHQDGIAMAPVAYTLGARIFEKHFTLHRAWKGSDQAFSLEPQGMRRMVRDLKRARLALGDGCKRRLPEEIPALVKMGRRGLAGEAA